MSAFSLSESLELAAERLGDSRKKRRADAGKSRLSAAVMAELVRLVDTQDKPVMTELITKVRGASEALGEKPPSRATIYNALPTIACRSFLARELPAAVRRALYNLDDDANVPAHQVVFYCFNYGELDAMSFAAAMPWLALYQAARMRGWRSMSKGPLLAAMRSRKI